jgi:hypothetical protein
MKSVSDGEIFDNNFKAFLYTVNTNQDKHEMKLKFKRQDLLAKAKYETSDRLIEIRSDEDIKLKKITMYNMYGDIDIFSKEIIISEIKPTDLLIFLGTHDQSIDDMKSNLTNKGINTIIRNSYSSPEVIKIKDDIIKVKYDSTILNKLPYVLIKDYGYIYNFRNNLLKVKRKRNEIEEIIITDETDISKAGCIKIGQENDRETFYSNDLKLINIKRDLCRLLNDKFYITNSCITNSSNDFKLFIRDNELVLEGSFSPVYLKIRNCIYSNYINIEE